MRFLLGLGLLFGLNSCVQASLDRLPNDVVRRIAVQAGNVLNLRETCRSLRAILPSKPNINTPGFRIEQMLLPGKFTSDQFPTLQEMGLSDDIISLNFYMLSEKQFIRWGLARKKNEKTGHFLHDGLRQPIVFPRVGQVIDKLRPKGRRPISHVIIRVTSDGTRELSLDWTQIYCEVIRMFRKAGIHVTMVNETENPRIDVFFKTSSCSEKQCLDMLMILSFSKDHKRLFHRQGKTYVQGTLGQYLKPRKARPTFFGGMHFEVEFMDGEEKDPGLFSKSMKCVDCYNEMIREGIYDQIMLSSPTPAELQKMSKNFVEAYNSRVEHWEKGSDHLVRVIEVILEAYRLKLLFGEGFNGSIFLTSWRRLVHKDSLQILKLIRDYIPLNPESDYYPNGRMKPVDQHSSFPTDCRHTHHKYTRHGLARALILFVTEYAPFDQLERLRRFLCLVPVAKSSGCDRVQNEAFVRCSNIFRNETSDYSWEKFQQFAAYIPTACKRMGVEYADFDPLTVGEDFVRTLVVLFEASCEGDAL